jgi:hypothetical protein
MYVRMIPQKTSPSPIRAGIVDENAMPTTRLIVPRRIKVMPTIFEKFIVTLDMFFSFIVFMGFSVLLVLKT